MTIFAFLSLLSSIISFFLGISVYFLDRKKTINRIFMLALAFNAYWGFTEFMYRQSETASTAYFWLKVSFLWPLTVALLLHFALAFAENKILRKKAIYFVLYAPALIFAFTDLSTQLITGEPILKFWGYTYTVTENWVQATSTSWALTLSFMAVFLCFEYYRKVGDEQRRQQAKFVTMGFSIPVVMGLLTEGIFPALNIEVPELTMTFSTALSVLVGYAILKYQLFSINPAVAADNIISTMPDSLILANIDGKILYVNQSLQDFSGYREDELIEKSIGDLYRDRQCADKILTELSKKGIIKNYETKFRTKSGEERYVVFSGSIVQSKKGQKIGFVGIISDITDRKQMEAKMLKAERFASIGELAGMIGHDLRNPMTSIQGAIYFLKTKYGVLMNSAGKEMVEIVERSIDYSNKMINDLLDYSREIRLDLTETTPKALLKDALSLVKVPKKTRIIDSTEEAPIVSVDAGRITRVFVNIIKNAIDAMPDGGTLIVTSKADEDNSTVTFTDTGMGMSKETLSKLWTTLFTTKAKEMGFGLPICKRVVEAHGGKIALVSTEGKGTTVTITIPITSEPTTGSKAQIFNEYAETMIT